MQQIWSKLQCEVEIRALKSIMGASSPTSLSHLPLQPSKSSLICSIYVASIPSLQRRTCHPSILVPNDLVVTCRLLAVAPSCALISPFSRWQAKCIRIVWKRAAGCVQRILATQSMLQLLRGRTTSTRSISGPDGRVWTASLRSLAVRPSFPLIPSSPYPGQIKSGH